MTNGGRWVLALGVMAAASWELEAEACSRPFSPPGYATKIDVRSEIVADQASEVACTTPDTGCGGSTFFKGGRRVLRVSVEVEDTAPDGGEPRFVETDPDFVLKSESGEIIERSTGFNHVTNFDKLGATVCVRTTTDVERNGIDGGAAGEYCVPVSVTSLEMSDADRAATLAAAETECRQQASSTSEQGGGAGREERTEDAKDDGGCHAAGGSGGFGGAALAGLLGLVLVRSRRRR